jgi:alkanesulfonate monooxygenase SsuD/methylene tetrahydromethanopterin reductase-like flavin-dependent oxidoreductase (luciferase family)
MASGLQFAFGTLGDNPPDTLTGATHSDAQKHRQIVAEAIASEAAGFDVFLLGEHHFNYYQVSAPFVALASIAAQTKTIRLGTGVTLLSTVDPVIVAEEAATLDVLSNGRAEIGGGRGIHEDIFRAMGRPAAKATEIVAENLALLKRLLCEENVTWTGHWRPPLENVTIRPRPIQQPIPLWSGSTAAIDLCARLGIPCMWGAVLYSAEKLAPFAEKFRAAWSAAGQKAEAFELGAAVHFHIAKDSQQARRRFEPYYKAYFERSRSIAKSTIERAIDPGTRSASPIDEVPVVGSPAEVVEKLGRIREKVGLTRIVLTIDMAGVPHGQVMEQIDLVGREVIPAFRT